MFVPRLQLVWSPLTLGRIQTAAFPPSNPDASVNVPLDSRNVHSSGTVLMRPPWWKQWVPLALWSQFIHFGSGQCTYTYGTDLVLTAVTLHFSWGRAPNCTKSREYPQGLFTSFLLQRPDHQRTTNEVCSHIMLAKNHVRCFLCDACSFGAHAEILTPRVFDHLAAFLSSFWDPGWSWIWRTTQLACLNHVTLGQNHMGLGIGG